MTLPRAGSRSVSEPSTESLADALNALCAELGIPLPEMLRTVEDALAAAYVRAFSPPGMVTVKLNTASGALDVTSRVRDASGSETVVFLPSEDFKRMAAQTAKHAVLRHIHDLERDKVLREVSEHRGELATGVIDRIEAGTVYIDLGRGEGARSCTDCWRPRSRRSRPAPWRCARWRASPACAPRSPSTPSSPGSTLSAPASDPRACATAPSSASWPASTWTSFPGLRIPRRSWPRRSDRPRSSRCPSTARRAPPLRW